MCGIVGVVGAKTAPDLLVAGLKQLEYRGYDSVGISLFNERRIETIKTKGRIENIQALLETKDVSHCITGIGHTRWATHGEPSDINSHPHGSPRLSLVHNGIIENYLEIKARLLRKGYHFESETDTEVLAKLLDYYYLQKMDPLFAIKKVREKIKGSYALGILFADDESTLYALRKDSPLIVGIAKDCNFIASDITAILDQTRDYILLDEDEVAIVKKDKVTILDVDFDVIEKTVETASWDRQAAEKGGYAHFMLKEITEQVNILKQALGPRIKADQICFSDEGLDDSILASITKFHLVACGTAMHAGMVGKSLIERIAKVPVEVEIASEFRYRNPLLRKDECVVVISQSGETADTLAALRLAKSQGLLTIAIVNVVGSSIAREADIVLYLWAGVEISVASTKAYFVMVSLLHLLALKLAEIHQLIKQDAIRDQLDAFFTLSQPLQDLINHQEEIKHLAASLQNAKQCFFLGRGLDYALALEASLKLKEISYIHSEAYPAGELKHGTISLIVQDFPVIALMTEEHLLEKMISNIKEVKARGAKVIVFTPFELDTSDYADTCIKLPYVENMMAYLVTLPLQLFAYYSSVLRGLDVDKPRNLAKSVTVE